VFYFARNHRQWLHVK